MDGKFLLFKLLLFGCIYELALLIFKVILISVMTLIFILCFYDCACVYLHSMRLCSCTMLRKCKEYIFILATNELHTINYWITSVCAVVLHTCTSVSVYAVYVLCVCVVCVLCVCCVCVCVCVCCVCVVCVCVCVLCVCCVCVFCVCCVCVL